MRRRATSMPRAGATDTQIILSLATRKVMPEDNFSPLFSNCILALAERLLKSKLAAEIISAPAILELEVALELRGKVCFLQADNNSREHSAQIRERRLFIKF